MVQKRDRISEIKFSFAQKIGWWYIFGDINLNLCADGMEYVHNKISLST